MTTALIATIDFFAEFQLTLAGTPPQRQVACTRPYCIFPIAAALLLENRLAIGFQLLAHQTCRPLKCPAPSPQAWVDLSKSLSRCAKIAQQTIARGARPPLTTTS